MPEKAFSVCIKDSVFIDPACGSGSLLLKAAKILGKDAVRQGFYGQKINITTYNLCRINMFLHDIDYGKFNIANEDTLINPQHWDDEPFEAIVSNPSYSIKREGDDNPVLINDPRFSPAGVLAQKSKADLAFVMHSLSWLATNGTDVSFSIASNYKATASYEYRGKSEVTKNVKIVTKIQKKAGIIWVNVSVDSWTDTTTAINYSRSHSVQLYSKGTYRAHVECAFSGTGGSDDEIKRNVQKTYS